MVCTWGQVGSDVSLEGDLCIGGWEVRGVQVMWPIPHTSSMGRGEIATHHTHDKLTFSREFFRGAFIAQITLPGKHVDPPHCEFMIHKTITVCLM